MALRLYDSTTREVRVFTPLQPGKASLYVCGLTVQSEPHVGHVRSGVNFDIYAQRINGEGSAEWITDGIPVSITSGDQVDPRLATDAGGRAVIAWEDSRSGTSWDIYAQRVNASGVRRWAGEV